jgi:hypothetical protein
MSDEYVQLETLISQRISEGSEYAAPIGGSHRQSVQLQDLDGDGLTEAIAFLADSSHTPTVCIYRQDSQGDYYLYVIITGEGSAISSVEYADITGDGASDLIIRWQISGDIQLLSAYSLGGEEPVNALLSVDCSEFAICDLDGDGVGELLDLRIDYGGTSTLVRYVHDNAGVMTSDSAALSGGITAVRRLRSGYLSDGTSALFIESGWGVDSLVTDVFTVQDGTLKNITMGSDGSSSTVRWDGAYATDINGDKAMEIPEASGDTLYWYSLDGNGHKSLALSTVHDYDDGWYLTLWDSDIMTDLTVTKDSNVTGEAETVFSANGETLFVIYTLTGENRLDRAQAEGRILLRQADTTVYAAQVVAGDIDPEMIIENFNLIYAEWQTGDL